MRFAGIIELTGPVPSHKFMEEYLAEEPTEREHRAGN